MSIMNILTRFAREQRARRRRARSYVQISELPRFIQKDIGFPDGEGFGEEIRNHRSRATETPQ